jgi:hypothetical protein
MSDLQIDPMDQPVWGAKNFAKILNRTEAKVFDDLAKGRFDGYVKKVGHLYVSTPRRLLASLEPTPAEADRNSA